MNIEFDIPKLKSSIIKVVGVGGGGSNAVNHMYQLGIKGVDFVVCNTDSQALETSPVPTKIQLGNSLTEGLGAGADPETGKKAAMESLDEMKAVFATNTKMVFITAGMGGGTGTGAAPVIAKLAKDMGILTVAIVTSPFSFEGPKRKNKATEGLETLRKNVDTILVINNERLREMYGNFAIGAAFAHADNILATAAKGIAEIITRSGYINVDFEDVKAVMSNSGVAIMGSAAADGEDRAIKAVEGALHSPLLADSDIHGASHILLNITSGTNEILMDEITIITNYIQEEAGIDADMNWGHCYDEALGEKIMVTLIATGFESRVLKGNEAKKVVSLDDPIPPHPEPARQPVADTKTAAEKAFVQSNLWTVQDVKDSEPALKQSQPHPTKPIVDEMEASFVKPAREESDENKLQRIRQYSETIKTNKGLDDMEREPAYKRKKVKLKSIPHSSESEISRYTLTEDSEENQASLNKGNKFLDKNID